jgi:hypothetical protein
VKKLGPSGRLRVCYEAGPHGHMQNVVNYMAGTIRGQPATYSSAGSGAVSHVDVRDVGAVAGAPRATRTPSSI